MKKLLLFAAIAVLGITSTNAQVKFGFGLGYAIPTGDIKDIVDGGVSGHMELGYGVTEDIDVSVLYQGDFLIGVDQDGVDSSLENVTLSSFMVNGRYFFTKEGFRPYGGLGLGMTKIGQADLKSDTIGGSVTIEGIDETNFSFRPSLGFKYKVLNVNAAYLAAGKVGDASVNDFTVNIGLLFTFGGN